MIADILNSYRYCSFQLGIVPASWLTAIVTPIPKVTHPVCLSELRGAILERMGVTEMGRNLRPISVTPILSRIAEKFVVSK